MCYAIPGKIVDLNGKTAVIEYYGERRTAHNELNELAVGNYVYAQGGYVIDVLPEAEALSILEAWAELFQDLKNADVRLSRQPDETSSDVRLTKILDRATNERPLTVEEIAYLLDTTDTRSQNLLDKTANFLRHKHLGNSCCIHGIIEISNICRRNCAYCGISLHNTAATRYRMDRTEILAAVHEAITVYGFKALVLQSGESDAYSISELADIIRTIKSTYAVLIFISFGEIGLAGLGKLYDAGARGLLMRFETSNPNLYEKLHPGYTLEARLQHLRHAYGCGYLILTGSLIGVPGQTTKDLAADILLAKELHAEMFSFGPFLAHPATPLKSRQSVNETLVLKTLAAARLADPKHAKILVTTGYETLTPTARERGLMAGANSVMLNVTPMKYRSLYSIYPNRAHENEEIARQIETTLALLKSLGRAPTDLGI